MIPVTDWVSFKTQLDKDAYFRRVGAHVQLSITDLIHLFEKDEEINLNKLPPERSEFSPNEVMPLGLEPDYAKMYQWELVPYYQCRLDKCPITGKLMFIRTIKFDVPVIGWSHDDTRV
jgi:hypothetical protein